jgi:hypothetical protein
MATKKPDYSAKAKVWLPGYTMELDGNALGVINSIFGSLPPEMREKALSTLQEKHAAISAKEAERAAAKAAAE